MSINVAAIGNIYPGGTPGVGGARMTDSEFRELVISKLDRLENGQLELHGGLRNLDGKVERILEIVQGLAASRAQTDERVAALQRAASR